MAYQILADSIVVLHFGFILFVILGALLIIKWRWIIWLHLPALIWAASIMYWGWICPLTPLENQLNSAAGSEGYEVGFIEHYIIPVIYPEGITPGHQLLLGALLVLLNIGIYLLIWRRHQKIYQIKPFSDASEGKKVNNSGS